MSTIRARVIASMEVALDQPWDAKASGQQIYEAASREVVDAVTKACQRLPLGSRVVNIDVTNVILSIAR